LKIYQEPGVAICLRPALVMEHIYTYKIVTIKTGTEIINTGFPFVVLEVHINKYEYEPEGDNKV